MNQAKLQGPGIYLDPDVSLDTAIEWLKKRKVEGETVVTTRHYLHAHPFDAALALKKAFEKRFGFLPLDPEERPNMVHIPNGVGTTVEIPWGKYFIPNTGDFSSKEKGFFGMKFSTKSSSGYLDFHGKQVDNRLVLEVTGRIKAMERKVVDEIVKEAQAIIKAESIYRGKILEFNFEGDPDDMFAQMPQFIAVDGVKDADLILPDDVNNLVATAMWTPLEYPEQVKAAGVPTKRGILLEGPPGTGKTLALSIAANKANRAGATVLYLKNVTQLSLAIAFMQDYGRGVIISEDIERVISHEGRTVAGRSQGVADLLNALDGIQAKASEIMVVLTTNFVKELDKALLRPGRFDAVVPVRAPDAPTVVKLIQHFGKGLIDPGANLELAAEKLDGQIPAVIREVVERAKLAQIRRTKGLGGDGLLTAADLTVAANGMLHHLSLLNEKREVILDPLVEAAHIHAAALKGLEGALSPQPWNAAVKSARNGQVKEPGNAGPVRA